LRSYNGNLSSYLAYDCSFIVQVTVIMIVNYDHTVITIINYDHKTFIVQANSWKGQARDKNTSLMCTLINYGLKKFL